MEHMTPRKRSLSLKKTSTPTKVIKNEPFDESTVISLSSDEDNELKVAAETISKEIEREPLSQESDSSGTLSYELSQDIVLEHNIYKLKTPLKSPVPSTSSAKSPVSLTSTPKSLGRPKFFSPNKKRSVAVKSPKKSVKKMLTFIQNTCASDNKDNNMFNTAAIGLDDKTKFLLKIICDYLQDKSLTKFLNDDSRNLLNDYLKISKMGMRLVCKLYWRKSGWYKADKIKEMCAEPMIQETEMTMIDLFKELCDMRFLIAGTKDNIEFSEFTSILSADELKDICKGLKIKTQSKKNAAAALQAFCRRSSIAGYFGAENASSINEKRALKMMSDKLGACFKLSKLARSTLHRLYILMYLGMDYDIIRQKQLNFMLINEKINRETYPIDKNIQLDNANVVFEDSDDFERYLFAHDIYEKYLETDDVNLRCDLVRRVYDLFSSLNPELVVRYKCLYPWLQRFTPGYIYVKILDEGIKDLKRDKITANLMTAVSILRTLIEQTFREHRKAAWYAELALLYHKYLNNADMAGQVLIEGFESNLSEESKDCMRPRAKLLGQMKSVSLDDNVRQTLLAFANKQCILEGSLPSHHMYKHAMENTSKGKAMYETKTEHERVIQGVEEYALAQYITTGRYTNGAHWEGRIVTTLFFLLFYDLIYNLKPSGVHGIFLSYYQRFPLDMFCPHFYYNRRIEIDERLKFIRESTTEDILEAVLNVWDGRPEHELSGINRDISRERLTEVVVCLGPQRTGALMSRVATNYHYAHSGFPDLTLWNIHTKTIKFVEVKSDLDRPSMKQIQWMQYLIDHGIETEFCYVGARTTKQKSRKPIKKEPAKHNTSKSNLNTHDFDIDFDTDL